MTSLRALRNRRATLVAVLAALGAFAVVSQPALAGGTPAAECQSGRQFDVADAGGEPDPGPPSYLPAGYYAQTAAFWPPRSALLCETGSGIGQPGGDVAADNGVECGPEARELLVPNQIPADIDSPAVAASGAYLPGGWYTLASADPGRAYTAAGSDGTANTTADAADPADAADASDSGDSGVVAGVFPVVVLTATESARPPAEQAAPAADTWTAVCWSTTPPAATTS